MHLVVYPLCAGIIFHTEGEGDGGRRGQREGEGREGGGREGGGREGGREGGGTVGEGRGGKH